MATPGLVLLAIFVVIPFLLSIWLSLHNVRLGSGRKATWIGLEQYRRILSTRSSAATSTVGCSTTSSSPLVVVPVQTGARSASRCCSTGRCAAMGVFRTFFFMPVVFPMALLAVIWTLIYSRRRPGHAQLVPRHRLVRDARRRTTGWASTTLALPSIVLMSIWQGVGFQMVIILAGLQGIPSSLYEAASIDKAGSWQQFLHVTVPGLRNTLIFVVLVTTIFSLRLFDQVYIMTEGGPQNATTTVMFQTVTTAFVENNVGKAAAMTVVFFVIVLAITLVQRRVPGGA